MIAREIENNPDAGFFEFAAAQVARKTRDEIIGEAVKDLFPQLTARESSKVRQMVCLAFDDKLTQANLTRLHAKEALMEDLRSANPDIAAAAQVADFLMAVQAAKGNR